MTEMMQGCPKGKECPNTACVHAKEHKMNVFCSFNGIECSSICKPIEKKEKVKAKDKGIILEGYQFTKDGETFCKLTRVEMLGFDKLPAEYRNDTRNANCWPVSPGKFYLYYPHDNGLKWFTFKVGDTLTYIKYCWLVEKLKEAGENLARINREKKESRKPFKVVI